MRSLVCKICGARVTLPEAVVIPGLVVEADREVKPGEVAIGDLSRIGHVPAVTCFGPDAFPHAPTEMARVR